MEQKKLFIISFCVHVCPYVLRFITKTKIYSELTLSHKILTAIFCTHTYKLNKSSQSNQALPKKKKFSSCEHTSIYAHTSSIFFFLLWQLFFLAMKIFISINVFTPQKYFLYESILSGFLCVS